MANQVDALSFNDHDSLIDFVRQYGRPESQGVFELYADGDALLLVRHDGTLPANPVFPAVALDLDSPNSYRSVRRADRLPMLLGAVASAEPRPETIIFWVDNQSAFQRLITANLKLGCDRLQVAPVRSVEGAAALLVRAVRPSFFVVDTAVDDEHVSAFSSLANGRVNVPWGCTHPLLHLWSGEAEETVFMLGEGPCAPLNVLVEPEWGDVYGLVDFVVAGAEADQRWLTATDQPERFVVELSLSAAHRPREVQLWMIAAEQQHRLESLLTVIPEDDLSALQFAAVNDPDGGRWLLIRERITGSGRQFIDFEGVRLGPYAGYPNLMLEIDQELEPPLRKDRYREVLDLRSGELCILWRDDERTRIIKVGLSAFQPLSELVDYIVSAAAETLDAIVSRSVFNFTQLEYPPRPAHNPRSGPVVTEPARGATVEETLIDEVELESLAVPKPPVSRPTVNAPVVEPEEPSALLIREAALELAIIAHGQTSQRWRELAQVKASLNSFDDESLCLREALWLTFEEGNEATPVIEALIAHFGAQVGHSARSIDFTNPDVISHVAHAAEADPRWLWILVLAGANALTDNPRGSAPPSVTRHWLKESTAQLARHTPNLRTKDRWLLWGRLVAVNDDAVAEARTRELLLTELTEQGLRARDTPTFIQSRIYQSRFLHGDVSEDSEAQHALTTVEAVEKELERSIDPVLTRVGSAILTYAFARLGVFDRSLERASLAQTHLKAGAGLTPIEKAWIALYLAAAADVRSKGSGGPWRKQFESYMQSHGSADLARSELEVIEKSIFQRAEADAATEFFSPENFRTLFPDPRGYVEARAIRDSLKRDVEGGRFADALGTLTLLAQRSEAGELRLDPRQFAWLLGPIVETLRRIGHASEGIEVLRKLEKGIDLSPQRSMLGLYTALFRLKIAEGYVELGEESDGIELASAVVRDAWKSQQLSWLDHLDMLGAALEAVEVSPLHRRNQPIRDVLDALFISHKHPSDMDPYRPVKLRLLDHCVEVALSKEKLSIKRYKIYLDQDEFHVRYRIVNEQLT